MTGSHPTATEAYRFTRARAQREARAFEAATCWLTYLESFPVGPRSREAAEEVERLAAEEPSRGKRELLLARLRELRDPFLPEMRPDSWSAADSHRELMASRPDAGDRAAPGADPEDPS